MIPSRSIHRTIPMVLLLLMATAVPCAALDDFAQPVGGWGTITAGKGSFAGVPVPGLEPVGNRAWVSIGVPDGTGGGPMYDPRQAWPLVVVLHGSNGNGESLAPVFRGTLKQMGAISLFPTALDGQPVLEWNYPFEMGYVLHLVRWMGQMYHIDQSRIYLIGHSMGGGGTYAMGSQTAPVWAALGPMAGWWQTTGPKASLLASMPIRILHGTADTAVPIGQGDAAYAALTAAGNTQVVYDRIAGGGHSDILSMGKTGNVFKMEQWLLNQRRSGPADFVAARKTLATYGTIDEWHPDRTPIGWWTHTNPQPPSITAVTANPSPVAVGTSVALQATANDPIDGTAVFINWDFGDSSKVIWGAKVSHVFYDPGTYTVTAVATNDAGLQDSRTVTVTVNAGSGQPPLITSADAVVAIPSTAFNYQITADHSPTLYHAFGLPGSWYCDPSTGMISGPGFATGTLDLELRAYNAAGSGAKTLRITFGSGRRIAMKILSPGFLWECVPLGTPATVVDGQQIFSGLSPGLPHHLSPVPKLSLVPTSAN